MSDSAQNIWPAEEIQDGKRDFLQNGFVHIRNPTTTNHETIKQLRELDDEWNQFPLDPYLPDNGRYRFRQYSRYLVSSDFNISILPHSSFSQPKEINVLIGDIEREYVPISRIIFQNLLFQKILRSVADTLNILSGLNGTWDFDTHAFRVVATEFASGQPIPGELLHTEGKDFVAIVLLGRENVEGGVSLVSDKDENIRFRKTLLKPLELLLLNDREVLHTATSISCRHGDGYRSILNIDALRVS